MTRSNRGPRLLLSLAAAWAIAIGTVGSPPAASAAEPVLAALPAWRGGIDLYRDGTFTTQKSWLWCTAAGVQIVRNIVDNQEDHSTGGQRRYFDWMRDHNRYTLPLSAGVDPQGWAAGLRHFVDDRYRLVASITFDFALRSAVKRLRLTSLPVALTVSHGDHGWILTGFTATADPSKTASFQVTSVRVVGPLYGLQSRNGYDMPPDTKLTPTQLKRYFTPWWYAPKRMVWDGRYVSIQPVPAVAASSAAPSPSAAPSTAASTGLERVAGASSIVTVPPQPTTHVESDAGIARSGEAATPLATVAALGILIVAGVVIVGVLAGRLLATGRVGSPANRKLRAPR